MLEVEAVVNAFVIINQLILRHNSLGTRPCKHLRNLVHVRLRPHVAVFPTLRFDALLCIKRFGFPPSVPLLAAHIIRLVPLVFAG